MVVTVEEAMVVTVDMAAVTMATGMVAATGISADITVILAVTMGAGSSPYPVRFREAVFAAIAPLPGVAARISARSATPRYDRETSAMR
jgi:hypothetical protein